MRLNKQTIIKILFSFGMLTLIFASSCKKENSMDAVITVKLMSDTTQVVAEANVVMSQGDITIEGKTDSHGVFKHTFELPIVLNVIATKSGMEGIGAVSIGEYLEPAHKTIFIK